MEKINKFKCNHIGINQKDIPIQQDLLINETKINGINTYRTVYLCDNCGNFYTIIDHIKWDIPTE